MANLTPEPSAELRRLGRAGPNAGEMDLLRAATMPAEAANAAWRRWVDTHTIDAAHHRSADLLPAVSANLPAEVLGDEAPRLRGLRLDLTQGAANDERRQANMRRSFGKRVTNVMGMERGKYGIVIIRTVQTLP